MRFWITLNCLFLFVFFSTPVGAKKYEAEVGMGTSISEKKYIEVETQFQQGLPNLLEKIKETATLVKGNQFEKSQAPLAQAIKELDTDEAILSKESHYKEIQINVDKIETALDKAEVAIKRKQKKQALAQLAQAYRWTKALAESPVLKLVASEIALGNASRQIRDRNYKGAGLFLQQAIDNLVAVQDNPYLNAQDIKRLKNNIIVTQQQVANGQLRDEKKLKGYYPGLAAARVNSLNTYYDIWTRSDMPWDQY